MALTSNQFSGDPALEACLVSDPAHVQLGAMGSHVARIQRALAVLGDVSIDESELALEKYGPSTADAVLAFKKQWDIRAPGQTVPDKIVGKKTLAKLDELMADYENNLPSPPPLPSVTGVAGVQIGPLGPRAQIVMDYYQKCALETTGTNQVRTVGLRHYSTFEELIDTLIARHEAEQVVVNHGSPESGLLIPFSRETSYRDTGKQIDKLSGLADLLEKGPLDPNDTSLPPETQNLLGAADYMSIRPSVLLRVVQKLVTLRKKELSLHFRACHMDNATMVAGYKSAFGAKSITYHPCRLLFVRIRPQRFKNGTTAAKTYANNSSKLNSTLRERVFDDPIGLLWPMLLAVHDIDGHTNIESFALIEHGAPDQIEGWAEFLIREWRWSSNADQFVVPVMWQNDEIPLTFYCPLEDGWRSKLQAA